MSAVALPKRLERGVRDAERKLEEADTVFAQREHDLLARLRDAEARRDKALGNLDAIIARRRELGRARSETTGSTRADLFILDERRRQCEAEHQAVVDLARDAVNVIRAKRAQITAERRALHQNLEQVRCEVEVAKIMKVEPPRPSCQTLAGGLGSMRLELDRFDRGHIDRVNRILQRAHDKERIERGEPPIDLVTPDPPPSSDVLEEDALLTRREAAFDRAWAEGYTPRAIRPQADIQGLLERATALSSLRRRHQRRQPLLARVVIIGSVVYLLILAGAFLGRAFA